jgi:hypothetical protein
MCVKYLETTYEQNAEENSEILGVCGRRRKKRIIE